MAGLNKVILIGNLGRDPEVMTFENGVKKASFSLATTESYRDKEGNWVDVTDWHNVVLWRWMAEKNLIKGDQIYIEGKLKTRSYDDKDGNKRYITEVVADRVLKLSGRREQSGPMQEIPPEAHQNQYPDDIPQDGPSDDLPF
ncbi:MAG: single-stranded DNA-binding protein [Candidatus Moranbacteria bacterium]|nr:single-stranded DNA-binding protein [Candidatus Moranbacteria bacterium]